jgi:hypothetical protein
MLDGYVVNNTGRGKHIFKRNFSVGSKIPIEQLYELYKNKYGGDFDLGFVNWLEETKIPAGSGFDIVLEQVSREDVPKEPEPEDNTISVLEDLSKIPPNKLSARQISELKIKDNPKKVIGSINSITKLRRAITFCNGRPGKETLLRYIRARISELQASGVDA